MAVVLTVILALVHAPGLLVRAHAELDKVVGRDRLPNFDDYGRLKFIEAIMLEAMRWRPVAPLCEFPIHEQMIVLMEQGQRLLMLPSRMIFMTDISFLPVCCIIHISSVCLTPQQIGSVVTGNVW